MSALNGGDPVIPGGDDTADWPIKADFLVDICNGQGRRDKVKDTRCLVEAGSLHHEAWPRMEREVATWAYIAKTPGKGSRVGIHLQREEIPNTPPIQEGCVKDRESRPRCLSGWVSNLRGFPILRKNIVAKGLEELNLRIINQDAAENFFAHCRSLFGTNRHPTCAQAHDLFKIALINKWTDYSTGIGRNLATKGNCEDDGARMLTDLQDLLSGNDEEEVEQQPILVRGARASDVMLEEKMVTLFIDSPCADVGAGVLAKQLVQDIEYEEYRDLYLCRNSEDQELFDPGPEFRWMAGRIPVPSSYTIKAYRAMTKKFDSIVVNDRTPSTIFKEVKIALQDTAFHPETCEMHCEELKEKMCHIAARLFTKTYCKRTNVRMSEEKRKIAKETLQIEADDTLEDEDIVVSNGEIVTPVLVQSKIFPSLFFKTAVVLKTVILHPKFIDESSAGKNIKTGITLTVFVGFAPSLCNPYSSRQT